MKKYIEKLEKIREEISTSYSLLEEAQDLDFANWALGYAYGMLTVLSSNIKDLIEEMGKE